MPPLKKGYFIKRGTAGHKGPDQANGKKWTSKYGERGDKYRRTNKSKIIVKSENYTESYD